MTAILLLTSATAWLAFRSVGRPLVGIDDANIFLAYARNIASGRGFVYNRAGERVEGFSSLAWVLVCALATAVSDRRETLLFVVNLCLVAATVSAVCMFLLRNSIGNRGGADDRGGGVVASVLAVPAWVYLSPSYASWLTVSLMDTALWEAAFTFGTLAAASAVGAEPSREDPSKPRVGSPGRARDRHQAGKLVDRRRLDRLGGVRLTRAER